MEHVCGWQDLMYFKGTACLPGHPLLAGARPHALVSGLHVQSSAKPTGTIPAFALTKPPPNCLLVFWPTQAEEEPPAELPVWNEALTRWVHRQQRDGE